MIDLDIIEKQVKDVLEYSQGVQDIEIHGLIEKWYEKKKKIIEAFGCHGEDTLILETEEIISFPMDDDTKHRKLMDFIEHLDMRYHNHDLTSFLLDNNKSFYENAVKEETSYKGKIIPKGMKLLKAIKYFEEDKDILNLIQSEASQLIQENKISGRLCFSVHPLDFLSSSENTYNWRSCHSLDGEYRAGNLSYMTDSATIICYLKSDEEIELPNFGTTKWNSKKWRVLIYLSDDWNMIAPGRQYPFSSDEGVEIAVDYLLKFLQKNPHHYSNFRKVITPWDMARYGLADELDESYIPHRGKLYALSDVVKDDCSYEPLHYNDLLRSSVYSMQYRIKEYWGFGSDEVPVFHIGNDVKCIKCGEQYIEDAGSDTMMCPDCEMKYGEAENDMYAYCDCCGARFFRDDGEWVGDEIVCPNCFHSECTVCANCGEVYFNDYVFWDEDDETYYCEDCMNEIQSYRDEHRNRNY